MQLVKADDPILRRVCRPSFVLDADIIQQMLYLLAETDGLALGACETRFAAHAASAYMPDQSTPSERSHP